MWHKPHIFKINLYIKSTRLLNSYLFWDSVIEGSSEVHSTRSPKFQKSKLINPQAYVKDALTAPPGYFMSSDNQLDYRSSQWIGDLYKYFILIYIFSHMRGKKSPKILIFIRLCLYWKVHISTTPAEMCGPKPVVFRQTRSFDNKLWVCRNSRG